MERTDKRYQEYIEILKKELMPAMGCTEPIAVAYCAAIARAVLGEIPQSVDIKVSGNILKNVKSVIVPNTGSMKGIRAAASAGIIAGDDKKKLEVISEVSEEQKEQIKQFAENAAITVEPLEQGELLDIMITVSTEKSYSKVRIAGSHTNVVLIEKNHEILWNQQEKQENQKQKGQEKDFRSELTVESIYDFALTVRMEDIEEVIGQQVKYNTAISEEGMKHDWGANIGKVLLSDSSDIRQQAKAYAAAGSDARMSGCELPVVVNSGSGNQGMTVSIPVICYARKLGCTKEVLYRALVLSNLIAIHQKHGIGCLSAYCGAVSAGAAAGCGIAFLHGGDLKTTSHTLVNALAITSGMICDGAKPSCAAKIAVAIDAGILGYEMYQHGQQFRHGEGIISKGVENTIRNVGRLGSEGMRQTDQEIIKIMAEINN